MLEPDAAKENRGVPSLALIRDGAFRVSSNVGVLTGPYVITVQGEDPNDRVPATTGNVAPGDETAAMPRKLFPPYSFEHVFSDKESFTLEIVVPHSK